MMTVAEFEKFKAEILLTGEWREYVHHIDAKVASEHCLECGTPKQAQGFLRIKNRAKNDDTYHVFAICEKCNVAYQF